MNNTTLARPTEANRDPITDAPGAHPVGTGVGALLGGAAAGAGTGTVAGPVGTVIDVSASCRRRHTPRRHYYTIAPSRRPRCAAPATAWGVPR